MQVFFGLKFVVYNYVVENQCYKTKRLLFNIFC